MSGTDAAQRLLENGYITSNWLVAKTFGLNESVLLGLLMGYGAAKPGQWAFLTGEEIEDATTLTRRQQDTARAHLREVGVLEEERRGLPARLYYHVNWAKASTLMADTPNRIKPIGGVNLDVQNSQTVDTKQPNSLHESAKLDEQNSQTLRGGSKQRESTESKQKSDPPAAPIPPSLGDFQKRLRAETKTPRQPRPHVIPEDWAPSDADRSYAEQIGLDPALFERAAEAFAKKMRASGERMVDWSARFQMALDAWKENERKREEARNAAVGSGLAPTTVLKPAAKPREFKPLYEVQP